MNTLRVAKERVSSYSSELSGYSDYDMENGDYEKRRPRHPSLSDSETSSPRTSSDVSSRSTSKSFEPMLSSPHKPRPSLSRRKSDYATSYPKIPTRLTCGTLPPRWSGRLFSLGLMGVLILFVTALVRSHWRSIASVESMEHKPPPPPPAWESFPFLKRYHGGIRTLVKKSENKREYPPLSGEAVDVAGDLKQERPPASKREIPPSRTYDPYAEERRGDIVQCYLDEARTQQVPKLQVYQGVPSGMPDPIYGSYNLLGMRDDICYERYGRLGPYGYGYSKRMGGSGIGMDGDREGIEKIWDSDDYVEYTDIKWAAATNRCEIANAHRFDPLPSKRANHFYNVMAAGGPAEDPNNKKDEVTPSRNNTIPRTAVIIRTWADYPYDSESIFYLRSLIAELSLASGGEYTLHFLIHVKDDNAQIWGDPGTYDRVLRDALPAEFAGMGTLWSERQMSLIYGGLQESNYRNLPVHGVYRSSWQPMLYFAHQHPEYEYYWQLEMDARYTGHWYHLLSSTSRWAKKQPRKGLWERNARFYIPSEHGSWEDFSQMVRVQTEHGTASKANLYSALQNNPEVPDSVKAELEPSKPEKAVWGPEPLLDNPIETLGGEVKPPTTEKEDHYTWGVGEEADLILFNPIFDPEGTSWLLAEDVTGYNTTRGLPPRRVAINTFGRYSKKLLAQMHHETLFQRRSMFTEMHAASTALHHGFKAVYAPHAVYIDRYWPTPYLASIFNGGRNGASGGARMSVFSDERQHNFRGTTWYYDAGHAPNLWKRWLGLKVDGDGGEAEEVAGEGRMCLPAMMIHPMKGVDLREERLVDMEG